MTDIVYLRTISSPAHFYHLVWRDLDVLDTPETITLTKHGNEFICIGQNKKEAASVPEVLIRHMCFWGWDIVIKNIQEPDCSGTKDISGDGVFGDILSKV